MGFAPVQVNQGSSSRWPSEPSSVASFELSAGLDDAQGRVSASGIAGEFTPSLLGAGAHSGLVSSWDYYFFQWQGLFSGQIKTVCLHPWLEGVGHGYGLHKTLSAKNVVLAMADKLRDSRDAAAPTNNTEAIAVVFNSATLQDLSGLLDTFCAVFPVPQLQMVARMARRMARYDDDSTALPEPSVNPPWADVVAGSIGCAGMVRGPVGQRMGEIDATAAEQNPWNDLTQLIEQKKAHAAAAEMAYNEVINSGSGGAGRYFYAQAGSPSLCADALLNANDFDHADVYSAGLLMAAEPGEMEFIKGVFGL